MVCAVYVSAMLIVFNLHVREFRGLPHSNATFYIIARRARFVAFGALGRTSHIAPSADAL